MSKKKFLIYSGIVLAVLLVFGGIYWTYRQLKQPPKEVFSAIPQDALFVLEINNLHNFCTNAQNNSLTEMASGFGQDNMLKAIYSVDSILYQNMDFRAIMAQNKIYLAGITIDSSLQYLAYITMPKNITTNAVKNLFAKFSPHKIEKTTHYKEPIYQVILPDKQKIYFTYHHNLLTISTAEAASPEKYKILYEPAATISSDKAFLALNQTSGKETDANLYLHYPRLAAYWQKPFFNQHSGLFADFTNMSDWVAWDLNIADNELLLNGFSNEVQSFAKFLHIYTEQTPQPLAVFSILPADASLCMSLNFNDYETFNKRYKMYLDKTQQLPVYLKTLEDINYRCPVNIENTFSWIGSEISMFQSGGEYFTAIACNDTIDFINNIAKIENTIDAADLPDLSGENVLNIPNYLTAIFQKFPKQTAYYYSFIRNYIVFARSESALQQLKEQLNHHKLYNQTRKYQRIQEQISEQSNIFLLADVNQIISQPTKSKAHTFFYQVCCNNQIAYTSCGLNADTGFAQIPVQPLLAETLAASDTMQTQTAHFELSEKIKVLYTSTEPIRNIYKPEQAQDLIFIETESNKLQAFTIAGKKLWECALEGNLLSTVYAISYKQKPAFAFNTAKKIYMYTQEGKTVAPYPLSLTPNATNGIAVFDYERNQNYRILYAGSDNLLYNKNLQGQNVEGWTKTKLQNKVDLPVQHVITNSKEYLVVTGKQGVMTFLDRKGVEKVMPKRYLEKNSRSLIYSDGLNFVTTGKQGSVVKINTDGLITINTVKSVSQPHTFFYEDFMNNGEKKYIYVDGKKLTVIGLRNAVTFERTLPEPAQNAFCKTTSKGLMVGIIGTQTHNVYLFNAKGKIETGLKGEKTLLFYPKNNKTFIVSFIDNRLIGEEI